MIKVTVGEQKTQKEKPFPKLMIGNTNWVVEVHYHPENNGNYIAIHRCGECEGMVSVNFNLKGFTDFNEPITIQNA